MTEADRPVDDRKDVRRVVGASVIGTTIETYDLFIYGTAAALVFPRVFFSGVSDGAALILSLLTFAASFVARPVGAIVLGHFGDRVGRKKVLIASLFVMGLATFLIALLPGYEQWGVAAPVLLVLLRVAQGIGFGGEWSGAITMVNEFASPSRRALFSSLPQMGSPLGLIFANLVFLGVNAALSEEAFLAWGWRIPFAFSLLLVALGFYLRRQVDETPAFRAAQRRGEQAPRMPFLEVLRRPGGFLLVAGSSASLFGTYYLVTTYLLSVTTGQLGVSRSTALTCLLSAAVVQVLAIPFFGWLAGKTGRGELLMVLSVVFIALWAIPLVQLTRSGTPALIGLAFAVYMIFQTMMYGPMGSKYPALFDTRSRYTGLGMGLNIGGLIGGGLGPVIAAQSDFGTATVVIIVAYCLFSLPFALGMLIRSRRSATSREAQVSDALR